jgi:hypothetical protein
MSVQVEREEMTLVVPMEEAFKRVIKTTLLWIERRKLLGLHLLLVSHLSLPSPHIILTDIIVGSIALIAGIIYLIRRVLRQRRLGKAYSPPPSPLLNAISDPLPSGIQRSMSERSAMGTGRSEFWSTSDSNTMIGPVGTAPYAPSRPGGVTPSTYMNESGTYRSELSGNNGSGGGGVMGAFGVRTELNGAGVMRELDGQPKEWNLDLKEE